ncbi:MAG: A/G-specific adenine glycosylase [Clostridiales bacterium]|nr:A/G-specific adenine glycosylase [Clostridiales bacterium]
MKNDYSDYLTALFAWYDANRRDLPWRTERTPYKTWISEVMLQQTRVLTVIPYFNRFIALFPDIITLASARSDDVYKAWEGLGYYSRASNLMKGARYIAEHHSGSFPTSKEDILIIPGIGPYIAGAILSMAFGEAEPSVDGNLIRVIARLSAYSGVPDASSTRKEITVIAQKMIPKERPGDFNEAMMDIGATICTPRSPSCSICPFRALCKAVQSENPELFPGSKKSVAVPKHPFTVCVILRHDMILIRKRPSKGLLAGLYDFPSFPGHLSEHETAQALMTGLGIRRNLISEIENLGSAEHRFSHMIWDMKGYLIRLKPENLHPDGLGSFAESPDQGRYYSIGEAKKLAFPTALRTYKDYVFMRLVDPS